MVVLWGGLGRGLRDSVWPRTGPQTASQIPQAAALHSQLHPHQPVHVLHAAGSCHPHPGPSASSPWPLPWGSGPYPVEPGEQHPSLSQIEILPPLVGPEGSHSIYYLLPYQRASLVGQNVKNQPAMQETWVRSLGCEDSLEKRKATHSSILAWRIPWTV